MSSSFVRSSIKQHLQDNSAEANVIDFTGENRSVLDLLEANAIGVDDNWLGIQFVVDTEDPISIVGGCYRESGLFILHVIAPVSIGVYDTNIIPRGETLTSLFRGKRINNDIVIESVTPLNTERGTTLEFDNGFTSGTFFINYYRDLKGV